MFGKLFGGKRKNEPPDKKTLAKLLIGTVGVPGAQRWFTGMSAACLETLDQEQIVERTANADDLGNNGADFIKGAVIQFLAGGPERIGFNPTPLTDSQLATAQHVYDDIRKSGYGELYVGGMTLALANAMLAWYAERYDISVAVATHVIENLDQQKQAGEAYRIRAFSSICLGQLEEARNDLRQAVAMTPDLAGAQEPLDALNRALEQTT